MRGTRLVLLVAGLLALAVVGAVIAFSDLNAYRGSIQALLTERLGREVSIGPMYASLSPLALRVDEVVIGEDPGFQTGKPFARVGTLYVSPRLLPLLRGRFELRSLELRVPLVELVRNAEGRWNAASLGGQQTDTSSSTLVLDRLHLLGGQIAITDHLRPAPARTAAAAPARQVYRNIDLQIDGFRTGQPFDVILGTTLPGAGTQRFNLRGTVGPLAPQALAATPFTGVMTFDGATLSALAQLASATERLNGSDAQLAGRLDVTAQDGRVRAAGALQFTDGRVRTIALGYPVATDVDITYDTGSEHVTITRGAIRLGTMPLSISGSIDAAPASPVLDLRLVAADAAISEAARLAAAAGVAFGAETRVDGRLQADVRARGPADRATLEGQVRLRDLSISGRDIPRPVRTPALDLTLTRDTIQSNAFVASVDDTSIGGRFTIGGYSAATPTIDASLATRDADLAGLLSIARAFGVQAADGVQGSGRLTGDVRATGPSSALRYSGSGSLSGASITTPALTRPIGIQRAAVTFASDAMTLDGLQVTLGKTTAEGRVSVRRFTAPVVDFQLAANTLDVVEMQQLLAPAPARAVAATPAAATAGDTSLLTATTGTGRLRVGTITNGPLVLENVQATVVLDRGVIRLDPLTAAVYGGRHSGAIVVDASRTPATFSVTSQLEQVDANKLASATTSLRDVLYGALASSLRVSASTNGVEGIAKSLNGTLSLNLPNGRLAKMDLLQEMANIGRFVTGRANAERATQIAALTGTFLVTNGVARTDDLRASLDGGMLGATGTINLVDQSVNMRLAAVLSREASQRAGGSRIGGFMTTALANEQGELVVPMLLSGTMSQPRFAPDVQRIAEMKLKNLVPTLRSPGSLGALLGAVTGRGGAERPAAPPGSDAPAAPSPDGAAGTAPEAGAPPPASTPADQIQDALRGLLGGRRRAAPPPPKPAAPAPAQPDGAGK
jgi:uncharacterized protein involved in outer membrane biogenesis